LDITGHHWVGFQALSIGFLLAFEVPMSCIQGWYETRISLNFKRLATINERAFSKECRYLNFSKGMEVAGYSNKKQRNFGDDEEGKGGTRTTRFRLRDVPQRANFSACALNSGVTPTQGFWRREGSK